MKLALFSILFTVFLAAPAAAMGSTAITTVYVYSPPKVSVTLVQSNGGLLCAWDITDIDVNDTFRAEATWLKDGNVTAVESIDCGTLKHCAALQRPKPATGETWKCSVAVTDSFGGKGGSSAEFQLTPLGFFGGLLQSLFSFFRLR